MKKYTHAWLAMMAMKRLQYAAMPTEQLADDAASLVKWFKDYRDFVVEGAWYPDEVFKDMATSHVIKYTPAAEGGEREFKKLPATMVLPTLVRKSPLMGREFKIESGNLADRCEAVCHDIVDDFKMLKTEDKGCPVSPSCNHIAIRFFILSHYIADCHMPLHCDSRSFSEGKNIHGHIESEWDKAVKKSYVIDLKNERFGYDPEGYPLLTGKETELIKAVEEDLKTRVYNHSWGTKNSNCWDYMSSVSEYSYLLSHAMLPDSVDPETIDAKAFKALDSYADFEKNSAAIMCDAVDSIARVWLHVWARYRKWAKPGKSEE
ncbi:MAG: hypothetical protein MJY72_02615 [Bacteroidales bacterium]|nr:hypothetical protein [Bacteroidales bacterium]